MQNTPPLARLRPRDDVFYVSRNRTVLATARDGFVHGHGEQGLFVCQTRVLSVFRYSINGESPHPVGVSNIEENSQLAYYLSKAPTADESLAGNAAGPGGGAATEALELRLSRFVSDGLREEVDLENHTLRAVRFTLEIEVDADFADVTETHGDRKQQGRIARSWVPGEDRSERAWTYTAEHEYAHQGNRGVARLCRGSRITVFHSGAPSAFDEHSRRIRFTVEMGPHGVWHCSLLVSANIDGRSYEPARTGTFFGSSDRYDVAQKRFLSEATRVQIGTAPLAFVAQQAMEQSRRDLAGFRLYDLDRPDGGWTLYAGLPEYVAFFGRDALTAAWQGALLGDEMMRGTLAEIADTQGTERNDWRDEQPGRFVHQLDTGPVATLFYNPLGRYYGTLTGPGFYPVVLSNLWHWTGDLDAVRRFVDPAIEALRWLDHGATRNDGFYAYRTRSEQGLKNQAWKDSGDAIVYPDGSQVKDPIAPCEFQAFVFASKVRMSELLWWLGEKDASKKFFEEAISLRDRFNDRFWMEEEGCFGMGLDAAGDLIRSVGSESAHAIAAGIVKNGRVDRTIARLFQPDLFSGWGLRTLSARHLAFNPFSYHRGSVWPAEQAAFCMGLMRYGFHDHLSLLAQAQFEAASLFENFRLPEVFGGHQRDSLHPIPGLYPRADSPQAWSASAVPCMIQALLGLFPYAPLHALFLDPHLPEWLPEMRLEHLRVGGATVDLRFHRRGDGSTAYEVLDLRGKLHVVRQSSPWSHTTTFADRLIDGLASLLPGH